jgi:hypothetical protein
MYYASRHPVVIALNLPPLSLNQPNPKNHPAQSNPTRSYTRTPIPKPTRMQSVNYQTMDGDVPDAKQQLEALQRKFKKLSIITITTAIFCGFFAISSIYLFLRVMYAGTVKIPTESVIVPTLDMAINHEITEDSAAIYNGSGNIKHSPYYRAHNFYNGAKDISKTLTILPKFQTYQQTSGFSCGAATGYMALRHFNITEFTENDIAVAAGTKPHVGTDTVSLGLGLRSLVGDHLDITWSEKNQEISWDQYFTLLKTNMAENRVTMTANIEWGGHWMVIIGYDDMGTKDTNDDVLIFADPFDTTDHNQDGYYVLSAERFYTMWQISGHNFEEGYNNYQFVTVAQKK